MQVSHLSIPVLIAFLAGCASTPLQEANERAATILAGTYEISGAEKTAGDNAKEVRSAIARERAIGEVQCSIAIPCPTQIKYGNGPGETAVYELWWTLKYTLWGQGSSKDWPWTW